MISDLENVSDNYKYRTVISLGWFCSIAIDLGKLGLREQSFPFDWTLSSFENICNLIKNNFENFMLYENMAQSRKYRNHYLDILNDIWFYHDFNPFMTFDDQYSAIKNKYDRRIKRFLNCIQEGDTLFIRYVKNDSEIMWINENIELIHHIFNLPRNRILFIIENRIKTPLLSGHAFNSFYIRSFEADVNRAPLMDKKIINFLKCVDNCHKKENIRHYKKTNKLKHIKKLIKRIKYKIFKKYLHSLTTE